MEKESELLEEKQSTAGEGIFYRFKNTLTDKQNRKLAYNWSSSRTLLKKKATLKGFPNERKKENMKEEGVKGGKVKGGEHGKNKCRGDLSHGNISRGVQRHHDEEKMGKRQKGKQIKNPLVLVKRIA